MSKSPSRVVVLLGILCALVRCGSNPELNSGSSGGTAACLPGLVCAPDLDAGGGSTASGGSDQGTGGSLDLQLDGGNQGAMGGGCNGSDACAPLSDGGPLCGDGQLAGNEFCDDGNNKPGDGCSGLCTVEPGYLCSTPGKLCKSTVVCGDGKQQGSEGCDDGNTKSNDGCSATCEIEDGYGCQSDKPGGVSVCMPVTGPGKCGDGVVTSGEVCDDNNQISNDGCSADCKKVEPGYTCTAGQTCTLEVVCGDGVVNGSETCDDSNTSPGDGCTGACQVEPNFACPPPGTVCTSTVVCGDGAVTGGEACDDGNTKDGDGCAADCSHTEPGYTCPTASGVGGACVKQLQEVCGDGALNSDTGEKCDDGNTTANDGCTGCQVDSGYTCPAAGSACKLIEWCGDGKVSLALGEQCDDGNTVGGDGCTAQCVTEQNFSCPPDGGACKSTVVCGDRKVTGAETCDDGNVKPSDGCSATCQVEAGWTCPAGGVCRATKCGDGIRVDFEQCDDKNIVDGDGCSSTCQLEPGYKCAPNAQGVDACSKTTCGDGKKEGTEQCDDGNLTPFDGCSPSCTNEPHCGYDKNGIYGCPAVCGDGIVFPSEGCDDGNTVNGDGCSSTCVQEPGYACSPALPTLSDPLNLPIIYRDFTPTHPQFEVNPGAGTGGPGLPGGVRRPNIPLPALGANGKPAYNPAYDGWTMNGSQPNASTTGTLTTTALISAAYNQWYTDVGGTVNKTLVSTLPLAKQVNGSYQYSSTAFFPLDGLGFGNYSTYGHNFHFTSELRYWFQYAGTEVLNFFGDDDVWVFVNGQLVVDLGGIHGQLDGQITLSTGASCTQNTGGGATTCTTLSVPLTVGTVYEIVVFQAERHVTGSNYQLTLTGFNAPKSVCLPVCGDGIVTRTEACDLGKAKNTGAYGTCNSDCTLPARCGDGIPNGTEQCDDSVNLATYGGSTKKCGPGCVWAPYCGDGNADGANGEACDEGAVVNGSGYPHCLKSCQLGPHCGDGTKDLNTPEQCDDGVKNLLSTDPCSAMCTLKCGNGSIDPGEACDLGSALNTGAYGGCTSTCKKAPFCGDGFKSGAEQCDDGKNDGSYGYCASGCVLGPRCGDGTIQTKAGELCDDGASNVALATAYGKNLCTTTCRAAPYCGDRAVEAKFGEACDDGVNSGEAGSCKTDCTGFVALPGCGDGTVTAPEQCDDGKTVNGTAASSCDVHCKKKCGNGVVDSGETCDDGVNNGTYGTCTSSCQFAGYCGDGTKNGTEQCDLGMGNLASPYGMGKCTTTCQSAPFCGDGRIQAGEDCDGEPGCSSSCSWIVPH